ncbi:circularly permuted type 2 ATP-grasp protein [Reichenbachiella ulvae]|uniref:Circularly permuted type 2 ATP-grasp protein n=1 Tax=Reichenbachiella ulvae TaxID=2980104 RepID=A0ABT3CQN0_9BACT|nr:circularly permuted type 2 ATP-grasp protein [Reichenbachiella ulvae]MCV9385927.1 circularly permuted type 2 ATP-grasp protein [Reichenbachiella ulvae]
MIKSYLRDREENHSKFLDELVNRDGTITPQWEKLAQYYERVGPQKLETSHEEVSRQLRENGVTYNIYGDPDGMNRPWNLDPVPMVFGSEDWSVIERGLEQRAELLNYILKDIYGGRKLIKEGLIPFELIYNHKGFLRQMDKVHFEGEQQLIQYSADLARGPNGKMWVLHDRTDAPSGAGYTFENRAAMTRVFPDVLRENEVRKITSYYQTLKNSMVHLSSRSRDNPRIVLLSPGPTNETYFEHAYISSFMGFTLAIGEDLTVSDGHVWLKTIKGLEKVDVIIRRVDDVYCDPLEFMNESHLGVVGLMEAVRQKNVLVINPLGVRILENPGLMAFLPKICRHVFNEELILNSVATWWCGHEREKQYVIDHFDDLIIRSIYRNGVNKSVYGGNLSSEEKSQLIAKINSNPYLYVGQERVDFSTTPAWVDNKFVARNAVFRSYIVADVENNKYAVMPGGLSRSSPEQGVFMVSNQTGGISKDTWVLGKGNEVINRDQPAIMKPQAQLSSILPSRTGEHLFWLGRYMERSAYTVRLMRMTLLTYNEADEDIHVTEDPVLSTLLKSLSHLTGTLPGFTDKKVLKNPEKELMSLTLDVSRLGTLAHSIQSFISNGFAVRDRLSLDTWRILDSVSEELNQMRISDATLTDVYHGLDQMVIKMMAFYGLNIDNMTRESTWHLLNIGRFIESATNTCLVLKSMLCKSFDAETNKSLLEDTLRCNESLVTYRYRYRSNLELSAVLTLLLVNESNPRSLIYQVLKIDEHLQNMSAQEFGQSRELGTERKKLLAAITQIRLCEVDMLCMLDVKTHKHYLLEAFLDDIIKVLGETSIIVNENYFNHTNNRYSMIQSVSLPEI